MGLPHKEVKTPGRKPLSKSTLYRIFTNPFYYGYLSHKQGLYKGNFKPIITQEEFERVQELLGRNERIKSQKYYFPYAGGFIKCGECGCSITAENKINRFGSKYSYYHCSKKKVGIKCQQKYVQEKNLEKQIVQFLEELKISKALLKWLRANIHLIDEEAGLAMQILRQALIRPLKQPRSRSRR